MDTSNITIETKNLYLKGITLEYKDDIFREFTTEITTHMFPKPAEKIEETIEFFETSIKENEEGSNCQIVVLDKKGKDFLGCAGIHHIDRKTPELGIWIKKTAHGNSYGKEAMIALKEWADKNLDYEYLLYPVVDENYPSRRIPEFLGGKIAREYDEVNMSGKKQHILEYRIHRTKK
ncbi:GNAT family N-acetyltransferase [Patescibacteria group bacterium]|nr:GNAT family N-acetyltransferase [Patescibacteria group bacterium]